MKRTVLIFGLLSGAVVAGMMGTSLAFMNAAESRKGDIFGYTGIVLGALLVFFGVRSYRENVAAGRISFGRGLAVGVLVALVSSCCYVATWEILYFGVMPGVGDRLAACMVERVKASGASQEKVDAMVQQTETYKKLWDNPLNNAAVTFIEPFPIGLAAALISAAVLRKK
jgi:hypothetical protein